MRILTVLLTALMALPAFASDLTKYNQSGDNPVKMVKLGKIDVRQTIFLAGPIRPYSLSPQIEFISNLSEGDDYYIIIDTPGGSVQEGNQFIRAMKAAQRLNGNNATCIIEGSAYSMGAVIASYCHKTYINKFAGSVMFHQVSLGVRGQMRQISDILQFVEKQVFAMESSLAAQLGMSYEHYKELTKSELWLTSEEAVKFGYVDGYAGDYLVTLVPSAFDDTLDKVMRWFTK